MSLLSEAELTRIGDEMVAKDLIDDALRKDSQNYGWVSHAANPRYLSLYLTVTDATNIDLLFRIV